MIHIRAGGGDAPVMVFVTACAPVFCLDVRGMAKSGKNDAGRSITLDDVAKLAGVSIMTGSRALRGVAECRETTRDRVRQAAEQLGYQPNPIVTLFHAAVRRRSGAYHATLGWLNDFPERGHHRRTLHLRRILRGAVAQALKRGFKLEEVWLENAGALPVDRRAQRYAQILRARGSPGVVLPSLCHPELAMEPWAELSAVCLGGMVATHGNDAVISAFPERLHHVQPDFFSNMELACVSLRAQGYRRIGLFISDWHNRQTGKEYEAAFRQQQFEWPQAERVKPLIPLDPSTSQENEAQLLAWVRKEKPDVVLCSQGETCDWLRRGGLRVPQDIGVAHMWLSDDTSDWSGIDSDLGELGAAAVDQLIAQVQANVRGQPAKVHRLSFLGRWVESKTTR